MTGPDRSWHAYFWPGTTVLKNSLGVTDSTELRLFEFDAVENRALEIRDGTLRQPLIEIYRGILLSN